MGEARFLRVSLLLVAGAVALACGKTGHSSSPEQDGGQESGGRATAGNTARSGVTNGGSSKGGSSTGGAPGAGANGSSNGGSSNVSASNGGSPNGGRQPTEGASAGAGDGGTDAGGQEAGGTDSGSGGTSTAGAQNGGSSGAGGVMAVSALATGALAISEIMADPKLVSDELGEWIEIYNASKGPVNLNGLTIATRSASVTISKSILLPRQGYALFARNAGSTDVVPDFVYGNAIDLSDFGAVSLLDGTRVIDEVVMNSSWPHRPGFSITLAMDVPHAADNDIGLNWCSAGNSFGAGDYGTPREANRACVVGSSQLKPGDLVIDEVMVKPARVSDELGEWFEILNVASDAYDLGGLTISDLGVENFLVSPERVIEPGQRYVFAANWDATVNGGVLADAQYGSTFFQLDDGGDEIVLSVGATVIDQFAYDATFPITAGASLSLHTGITDAVGNDTKTNWCAATSAFATGSDKGSPGKANSLCP